MVEEGHPFQDSGVARIFVSVDDQGGEGGHELDTYSCLVLPRRVVFSFWEVTDNVSSWYKPKRYVKHETRLRYAQSLINKINTGD